MGDNENMKKEMHPRVQEEYTIQSTRSTNLWRVYKNQINEEDRTNQRLEKEIICKKEIIIGQKEGI